MPGLVNTVEGQPFTTAVDSTERGKEKLIPCTA
jgi:hypothetical protein